MANDTQKHNLGMVIRKIVTDHKETAAILSKYQKLEGDTSMANTIDTSNSASYPLLKRHSEKNNDKTKSSDDIKSLFPDAVIGEAILTASILTPNSYDDIALNYIFPTDFPMPDTIKKAVCGIIEEHITKYYKLEEKLKDIVKEAIFEKGAYIECFLPEASLDDAINNYKNNNYKEGNNSIRLLYSNSESNSEKGAYVGPSILKNTTYSNAFKNTEVDGGLLSIVSVDYKTNNSYGMKREHNKVESLKIVKDNIEKTIPLPIITDNLLTIRNIEKDIKTLNNEIRSGNLSYLSLDSAGNVTYTKRNDNRPETKEEGAVIDFLDMFSKNPNIINNDKNTTDDDKVLSIDNRRDASRKSIGRPLCLKLNTEAVIPIHSPYDKKDHIGYFVLLDENGKLLDMSSDIDGTLLDPEDPTPLQVGTVDPSTFISQGRRNTEAMTQDVNSLDINEEIFTNIVHGMVSKKLKEGKFGDLAVINRQDNQLIYKMMFFRALKNRGTQMLFLPCDLVSYFAYDYRADGTGRSMLEKSSFLYSLRAMLLMSTINATLTNATNTEEITVDLDQSVTDVEAVLAQIQQGVLENRLMTFPIGVTNPITLQTMLAKSGYKFNVNSPRLPQVSITTSDTSRSVVVPDEAIDDKLKNMQLLSMGITPELVKQGAEDVEFATIANNRHLLFNERVKKLRERTNDLISVYVRKVIKNDEELRVKIEEYVISNFSILSAYLAKNINKMEATNDAMTVTEKAFLVYVNKSLDSLEEGLKIKLPKSELDDGGPIKKQLDTVFGNIDSTVDALFSSDIISSEFLGETIGNKANLLTTLVKTALKRKWVVQNNAIPDLIELIKPVTPDSDQADNIFVSVIKDLESIVKQFAVAYNIRKDLKDESDIIKKIDDSDSDMFGGGSSYGGDSYGDDNNQDDDNGYGGDDDDNGGDEGEGDGGDDDLGSGDEGDEGSGDSDDDSGNDDDSNSDDGEEDDDDNPTKGTDDEIEGWV